jgi:hydrogenase maturation protease
VSAGRILVYGYGNPGRQDDGLGSACIALLESDGIPGVDTDCNYQLNIEDAANIADYQMVIFVDASTSGEGPYSFYEIGPSEEIAFTTHSMSPRSVLALCHEIYGRNVSAHMLEIRGYGWDFTEGLTPEAERNLQEAFRSLKEILNDKLRGVCCA